MIGGQGSPETNRCVTKLRAEALGCEVSGNYKDNQLVQQEDLSAKGHLFGVRVFITIEKSLLNGIGELSVGLVIQDDMGVQTEIVGASWIEPNQVSLTDTYRDYIKGVNVASIQFKMDNYYNSYHIRVHGTYNSNTVTLSGNTNELLSFGSYIEGAYGLENSLSLGVAIV